MKSQELDKTDKIILSELQKNAQRPIADLAQKAGVYSFQERFVANVQKHTAKKLEDGLLALLHCQRERRSLGEEDDVLLERFLARWFDGVATPGPEDLEW